MAVPNRKAVIDAVLARFAGQIVAPPDQIDGTGRSLLPHFIEAMPADERQNWAVLEKRTSRPYSVPYDILVWLPTREHFDVLTSAPVSGKKDDKTGPRRLIARWESAGILPKPTWYGCDWRATQTPIVPLGEIAPPDEPDDPPSPPAGDLAARVTELERELRSLKSWAGSAPK